MNSMSNPTGSLAVLSNCTQTAGNSASRSLHWRALSFAGVPGLPNANFADGVGIVGKGSAATTTTEVSAARVAPSSADNDFDKTLLAFVSAERERPRPDRR